MKDKSSLNIPNRKLTFLVILMSNDEICIGKKPKELIGISKALIRKSTLTSILLCLSLFSTRSSYCILILPVLVFIPVLAHLDQNKPFQGLLLCIRVKSDLTLIDQECA